MADNLYTTLRDIQVTRDEIVQAETFSRQYLRSYFPDLDLREGVALNDLVIRPFSTLLAMVNKGLTFYFQNNTLAGVTDETPEDMVDKILSNLFLTRLQGSSSIVRARLYFLSNGRDVVLQSTNTFSTDNEIFFRPITDTFISSQDLIYDPSREEYYYDLDLISSSQVEAANIESGDFIYHSNIDPFFLQASVLFLVQKAIPRETNTEFIARAQTAVSTRNLINDPSIDSIIKQTFNYIKDVVSVGYGDQEMFRDLIVVQNPVTLDPEQIHIGGKVDVYVNSEISEIVVEREVDATGCIYIEADQLTSSYVIFAIERIQGDNDTVNLSETFLVTPGSGSGVDFQPLSDFNDVGFSMKQSIKIAFSSGPALEGETASFNVRRFSDIAALQEFLDDTSVKVVCADYLARALDVYEVDINVKKITGLLTTEELAAATAALENFFSDMRAGQTLLVSDLVETLINDGSIPGLDVRLQVNFILYDRRFTFNNGDGDSYGVIEAFKTCDRTQKFILGEVTSQ